MSYFVIGKVDELAVSLASYVIKMDDIRKIL